MEGCRRLADGGKNLRVVPSLRPMFTGVAETYDLLNRVLTFGFDGVWRRRAARECTSEGVILDLCCGTGDLGLSILRYTSPETLVLGLDFTEGMLRKAAQKVRKGGGSALGTRICFVLADAAYLPIKDGCVHRVGISFSFRNLVYRNPLAEACLKEALRVLSPNGRLVCAETSQPPSRLLRCLYHLYLATVVPFLGRLLSGRRGPYRYLANSAVGFPPAEEIAGMLLSAGFREAWFKRMTFGIVCLHVALK